MSMYRKDENGNLVKTASHFVQRFNNRLFQTTHTIQNGADYYKISGDAKKYITGLTDFTEFQLYISEPNQTSDVYIEYNGKTLKLERLSGEIAQGSLSGRVHTYTLNTSDGKIWQGPEGPQGPTGPQGLQGPTGPQGIKGDEGVSVVSVKQITSSEASGGRNVIAVTLSDGTVSTFTVLNGKDTFTDLSDYSTTTQTQNLIDNTVSTKSAEDRQYADNTVSTKSVEDRQYTDAEIVKVKNYTDTQVDDVKKTVAKLLENAPDAYDTLAEIATYIENDQSGASQMLTQLNQNTSDITANKNSIEANKNSIEANKNSTDNAIIAINNSLTTVNTTLANKVNNTWIRIAAYDSSNTKQTYTTSTGEDYKTLLNSAQITHIYLTVTGKTSGDWNPDFRVLRYVGYGNGSGVLGWNFENSLYMLTIPYSDDGSNCIVRQKYTDTQLYSLIETLSTEKATIEYVNTKASGAREGAESYAFSQANLAYNNAKSYADSVVATKANIVDVYTKTEIDTKETTLNQSIENVLLEAKAYADQIAAGGEANLEGYVKTVTFNSAINTINANKANIVDVYNKTEIGNLLNDKANNSNPVMNGSIELIGNTYSLKIVEHTADSQGAGGGIRIMAKPSLSNSAYDNTNSILIRTSDAGIQIGEDYDITYNGIFPLKDSHKTLGASSYKFKELWLSGKMSDGTNEITIADLVSRYTNAQIDEKINLLLDDEGATSTLDSFKEIRDYLAANQDSADLVASVQKNTNDIIEVTNSISTINIKISTIDTTLASKADKAQLMNYRTEADAEEDYDYLNGRIDNVSAVVASNGSSINKLQTTVAGKQDALGYTPVNKAGDTVGVLKAEDNGMTDLGATDAKFNTVYALYLNNGTKDIGIGSIVTEKTSFELSPGVNTSTDTIIGNIKIGNTNNYVYAPNYYTHRVSIMGIATKTNEIVVVNTEFTSRSNTKITISTLNTYLNTENATSLTAMKKSSGSVSGLGMIVGLIGYSGTGTILLAISKLTDGAYTMLKVTDVTIQSFVDNVIPVFNV